MYFKPQDTVDILVATFAVHLNASYILVALGNIQTLVNLCPCSGLRL